MKKILKPFREFIHNEEGSTIVIVALVFTVLTIFAALVLDMGLAYYKTAEIENAADAAALAAGRLLPVAETDTAGIAAITQKAIEYAAKNGITTLEASDIELSSIVDGSYTQLKINISVQVETSLAKVISVNFLNVARNAKVKIAPCAELDGAVPLSIEKSKMETYIANGQLTHLALKVGGGDGTTGSFGAIDLDGFQGGGANDYEQWLNYGYTAKLSVGEQLYPVETGNMANPTKRALIARYNRCTHFTGSGGCTAEHYDFNCPRVVKVPVVEYDSAHRIKIRGFAAFVLEDPSEKGYVYGSFIKIVTAGSSSNTVNIGDALDYGIYNVILIG